MHLQSFKHSAGQLGVFQIDKHKMMPIRFKILISILDSRTNHSSRLKKAKWQREKKNKKKIKEQRKKKKYIYIYINYYL